MLLTSFYIFADVGIQHCRSPMPSFFLFMLCLSSSLFFFSRWIAISQTSTVKPATPQHIQYVHFKKNHPLLFSQKEESVKWPLLILLSSKTLRFAFTRFCSFCFAFSLLDPAKQDLPYSALHWCNAALTSPSIYDAQHRLTTHREHHSVLATQSYFRTKPKSKAEATTRGRRLYAPHSAATTRHRTCTNDTPHTFTFGRTTSTT